MGQFRVVEGVESWHQAGGRQLGRGGAGVVGIPLGEVGEGRIQADDTDHLDHVVQLYLPILDVVHLDDGHLAAGAGDRVVQARRVGTSLGDVVVGVLLRVDLGFVLLGFHSISGGRFNSVRLHVNIIVVIGRVQTTLQGVRICARRPGS